jgi:hypothetical protein
MPLVTARAPESRDFLIDGTVDTFENVQALHAEAACVLPDATPISPLYVEDLIGRDGVFLQETWGL